MRFDMFRPSILLVFYAFFMALVLAAFSSNFGLPAPSLMSFVITFGSFPFLLFGAFLGNKLYKKKVPMSLQALFILFLILFYTFVSTNFFGLELYTTLFFTAIAFSAIFILFKRYPEKLKPSWKVPSLLVLTGVLFLFLAFASLGGIPLLNAELRQYIITNVFWGACFLLFFVGYALLLPNIKKRWTLFLTIAILTLIFTLSAMRGAIIPVLLAGTFFAYYSKKLDNKTVFLPLLIALFLIAFLGYASAPIMSPDNLLLYRAGSTYTVFDSIVRESMPYGYTYGTLFFRGNPRDYVGQFMGYGGNLTYTMLGQSVLDFGFIGAIVFMLLLGFILQLSYRSMKDSKLFQGFYPLLLSISLVWIETGPDQLYLAFFFIFFVFYMIKNS